MRQLWQKWTEELRGISHAHPAVASSVLAALVVGLAWLLLAGWQDRLPTERKTDTGTTRDSANAGPLHTAVLFYVAEDGTALVREEREVDFGEDTLARARIVAEAQLTPPSPPLISPFPEGTTLRVLYLADGGNAFVDLSPEVTLAHPGGSLDELFTVYALVNALTTNLPGISAVQILVEGQEVDTLAGHVDLRRPLALNMKWVTPSDTDGEDSPSPADN